MAYKTIIRSSFPMNTRFLYLGKLPSKSYATTLELPTFLTLTSKLQVIYIKHETQCFITRWSTEKRVENTTRSIFLTDFAANNLLHPRSPSKNTARYYSFVFSLSAINEFEKFNFKLEVGGAIVFLWVLPLNLLKSEERAYSTDMNN